MGCLCSGITDVGEGRFGGTSRIAFVLGRLGVLKNRSSNIVCFEQTETSPILPLRMVADLREEDSRSPKTKVGCNDNRDAYASTHKTAHNQVRPLPFAGESQRESFEELSCFTPDQTIGGDDKRSEVLALFETTGLHNKYCFFFSRSCVVRSLWGSRD
jgi:hypothetical protein